MYSTLCFAANTDHEESATGPFWAVLLFIAVLLAIAAWFSKNYRSNQKNINQIRMLSCVSLGGKERVALIEVAGRKLVLGVGPGNITPLADVSDFIPQSIPDADEKEQSKFHKVFTRFTTNNTDSNNEKSTD